MSLLTQWEESQRKRREQIAAEKAAFNEGKEAQMKINAAKKELIEQNKRALRIEKAREDGRNAAMIDTSTELLHKAVKGTSSVFGFIKAHVKPIETEHTETQLSSKHGSMKTWHLKSNVRE